MGDWNGVLDTQMDKKGLLKGSQSRAKLPKAFFDIVDDLELLDIWRERNPQEKDFTFFSDRHQSFSRIDLILITNDLLSRVKKVKILPRTLADHSPVWMEVETERKERRSWRLNENLFRYEENINECKKQMKEFFVNNLHKGTGIDMVWDASKAYMRGILMNINKRYKDRQQERRKGLEEEIKEKEKVLIYNPADKRAQEAIRILRGQFNMLMADQVATNLQFLKHNNFNNANKPGRWLAYWLRKRQRERVIEKIEHNGTVTYQQELIKKAFVEFYSRLYKEEKIQGEEIENFLSKAKLSKITQQQRERINQLITEEEIMLAIKQLKVGKAPGTDGITAVYYKKLQSEMVEPLQELFVEIQKGGRVPPSWKSAYIALIPKEGQDHTQVKNYRPISLLNTDYKIFAKIMANRLMPILQKVIHEDQTGFIAGRQMKYNIRQIVNILEVLEKRSQDQAALIFLDAEKAFDQLNWDFLLAVIEKMEMGEEFLRAIQAIYQKQTAQVIINGSLTEIINIEKGTRQGCPLSPLLFVLSLEILLNKIREKESIKGIKVRKQEYKLRAFADDVVVTLGQPRESIGDLMRLMEQYGKVSGFKINKHKTKIITKNLTVKQKENLGEMTGCEIVKKVKYLGIYIAETNGKLYKNNYEVLWLKVQNEMEKWKKLQLSWLGRIAAIKMNILPKFLFLFQMIPILKKDFNLNEWQKGINQFVWAGKKARVKFKIIQDVRERGGLRMPNLKLYYEAAALSAISDWFNLTEERVLNIESHDLICGWHAYLLYDKKMGNVFKMNIMRNALIRVWKKYRYKLDYRIPMWAMPRHAIGNVSAEYKMDKVTYREVLEMQGENWRLKSLKTLKEEGIVRTWFQYGQLLERWKEDVKIGLSIKEEELVKQIRQQGRYHIKRLYKVLVEMDSETELVKECMIKWAQNFQEPILMETWERIWVTNVKFTQAQNLRENFYKMFYRWHLDPKKISYMCPSQKPKCWRCDFENATYYHIWWTCKKVKVFWIHIWWNIQKIFGRRIEFTPHLFLLGIVKDLKKGETKLMLNLVTAARLLVAQYWKREEVPTVGEWITKVSNLAEMAKISAYLKDQTQERYIAEWKNWIGFVQKKFGVQKYQVAYE